MHEAQKTDLGFLSFAPSAKVDWAAAARQELKGEDPFQKLAFNSSGVALAPYYDESDRNNNFSFQLPESTLAFRGARSWLNMPRVHVISSTLANKQALEALQQGADGILFEVGNELNQGDLHNLLENIDLKHCAVSFLLRGSASAFIDALHDEDHRLSESTYQGALYAHTGSFFQAENFDEWQYFKTAAVRVEGTNAVDELSNALEKVVAYASLVPESKKEKFFERLTFLVEVRNDFFENIAKLKALHLLWNQLLKAYHVSRYVAPTIHAFSLPWIELQKQHSNLIKSTTAALSAVLGGCTALTVEPESENHSMMVRIARNVSNILRDESHLSKVTDPTAGAYYLDYLTEQFARRAWNKMIQSHEG